MLEAFLTKSQNISPYYSEWAIAMAKANDWWDGASLDVATLNIPIEFSAGLPANNAYRNSIYLPTSTVTPTSTEGQNLIRRITQTKNENIDKWFLANPDTFQALSASFTTIPTPPIPTTHREAQPTTQPSPPTIVHETRKDRIATINVNRARTVTQLLLARNGTNSDGDPILIPGVLSQSYEDALQDSPNRSFRILDQQYRSLIDIKGTGDNLNMIDHYMKRFPFVIINQAFAASLTNGYWATQPYQQSATVPGANISLFTFAPARSGTAEHKRQFDETNAILGEELVGATNSQRTKPTLKLYDGGTIQHYSHLLYTLANLLLVLEAADAPNQDDESILVQHLKEFFKVLARKEVEQWIETFTKTSEGEHLPYALALDMHNNSLIHFARFATDPQYTKAALTGEEIPASAIDFYQSVRLSVINNWRKAAAADNLGPYASPPSTWISARAAKEASKKTAKTTEGSTPSSRNNHRNTSSTSQQPTQQRTGTGSDPNLGLLQAPDSIRNGPQLPNGKRLCLPFASKGKTCPHGFNCTGGHVTLRNASLPELQAIDRWVTSTPNVSWQPRRPPRLSENDQTNQTSPSPTSRATPVTPSTTNSSQTADQG
jgi:hypothetical protein